MPRCTFRVPTRKQYRKVVLCEAATMVESVVFPGGAANFRTGAVSHVLFARRFLRGRDHGGILGRGTEAGRLAT